MNNNIEELLNRKQIPGFSKYYVDNKGHVYDCGGIEIKQYTYDDGHYNSVHVIDDSGKHRVIEVHRIVAKLFDPYYFEGCVVHHIDEDKHNNDISNLKCMTLKEHVDLHAKIKYYDMIAICQVCGKPFLWKAAKQQKYYSDLRINRHRIRSCSKSCAGFYARLIQLKREKWISDYIE